MNESVLAQAEAIAAYAAMQCADCGHRSSLHSDIGNCGVCDCLCFEEAA